MYSIFGYILLIFVILILFFRLQVLERRLRKNFRTASKELLDQNYQLDLKNTELAATNEEFEASMEELEAMNEEFEAQNIELLESQELYRISEKKFRNIIEFAPFPTAVVKKDGGVEILNKEFIKVFGFDFDDLENIEDWWIKAYNDETVRSIAKSKWNSGVEKSIENNISVPVQQEEIICKDGTQRIIEFHTVVIEDIILVIMNDLTEKQKTENFMMQTEKMMTVGGLASGIAHEVNNPLGIILQAVHAIFRKVSPEIERNNLAAKECGLDLNTLDDYFENRGITNYLENIKDAGGRAATIISNMLKFSKRVESDVSPKNINLILENSLDIASKDYDLSTGYDFKNIKIVKNFNEGLTHIVCVENEMEQVFVSILMNSSQAMRTIIIEDYLPEIVISTELKDGIVSIIIKDNGPGMDQSTVKHIFEPFFTTKDVRSGAGLGLSVSYFIITNNHNGKIEVSSKLGEGTIFTITIPQDSSITI